MRKKSKINKNHSINQKSFYFEDYLETNKKIIFLRKIIFFMIDLSILFSFFSLIIIFSFRIVNVSLKN